MGDLDAAQYVKIRLKVASEDAKLQEFLVNAVSDADIRPWKVTN